MPFRNLKVIIILIKVLGMFSCKLVNGRLKSSSVWSYCYCTIWILFHCSHMGVYYYNMYVAPPAGKTKKDIALELVRTSMFFVSILPYCLVTAFWSEDFVKLSDKLLTYDEQAIALGHQRKDKHIFSYLFFVYTFITISWKFIYGDISEGAMGIIRIMQAVVFPLVGTYSILVTCMFLDLVRQRFRHLNETIIPHVSQLPVTGSPNEITVYDVRYLHGTLLDGAQLINSLYGISTLLIFLSVLLDFVWDTYILIKEFQNGNNVQDNFIEIMDLFSETVYLFTMYHFTTYEANRVEERVIKYGLPFSNRKCRMDKIEMMLYFRHRRYSFTAAEFFPLDITIFLPITTGIITYLTLIV